MGVSEFKKDYQPRNNTVKDENGDVFTSCHSILASWRNNFPQLFIVHGVNNVRQPAVHTTEPLFSEPIAFELEMAIDKSKGHKAPSIEPIPAELIKAWVQQIAIRSIKLLFLFGIRRNFLRS